MIRRLLEMLTHRPASESERALTAKEIERQTVKSDVTLNRAAAALRADRLASYHRVRAGR